MTSSVGQKTWQARTWRFILAAVVTLLAAVWAFPFVWAAVLSVKESSDIVSNLWSLPKRPTLDNYRGALDGLSYGRSLGNSLFVSTSAALLQCATGTLAAFAFARLSFPGRDLIFTAFLATLMIPTSVTLTANFLILRDLGMIDTYWALIIPSAASGFAIFLLRQFFLTIPRELQDAAKIDGAGPLRFLWHVVMPLSRPALTTVFVFIFISNYNEFLWPLIMTTSERLWVVQIALSTFTDAEGATSFGPLMAAAVLTLAPTIALFALLQRAFVRGISRTGIK